jgi:DNA invertase Pin-like site-specific DNA recombinase
MNCIIYARVSTDRQADRQLSIPARLQAAREHARRHEWDVLEEYVEPGCSGRTANRPVLHQLLNRCRQKPKVDVVLVHKIDRLARNVYDHATIRAFLRQRSVKLASVVEAVDDSVAGQLLENIMASIAEFYSANLAQETKKGMQAMVERGGWPHQPPRGYKNIRGENGRPAIVVDDQSAPAIRRAFELYATGSYSFRGLEAALVRDGFSMPVSPHQLRRMLQRRFYAGWIRWNGNDYRGQHVPIVPDAVFEQVAYVLKMRHRQTGRKPAQSFLLRGVARCGRCGTMMTAEQHRRWGYYRCTTNTNASTQCVGPYSNADVAHKNLEELYGRVVLTEPVKNGLQVILSSMLGAIDEERSRYSRLQQATRERLERRRLRAAEALADGVIAKDVYQALAARIEQQLESLGGSEADADSAVRLARAREAVSASSTIAEVHSVLDAKDKAAFAKAVFERVVLLEGRIIDYEFRSPIAQPLARTIPQAA